MQFWGKRTNATLSWDCLHDQPPTHWHSYTSARKLVATCTALCVTFMDTLTVSEFTGDNMLAGLLIRLKSWSLRHWSAEWFRRAKRWCIERRALLTTWQESSVSYEKQQFGQIHWVFVRLNMGVNTFTSHILEEFFLLRIIFKEFFHKQ